DLRGGRGGQLYLLPEAEAVRFERADGMFPAVLVPQDGTALSSIALSPGDAYVERARVVATDAQSLRFAQSDASTSPLAVYVAPPPDADALRALATEATRGASTPAARAHALVAWFHE